MKMFLTFSLLAIALTAVRAHSKPANFGIDTPEELGKEVLESLRHQSVIKYAQLFPSLKEMHQLMEEHANIYQVFLNIAREDFAMTYQKKVIPEMEAAFNSILKKGNEKGIEWSSIEFISAIEEKGAENSRISSMNIVFSSKGTKYQLVLEKVLITDGQWKVTQFINFK